MSSVDPTVGPGGVDLTVPRAPRASRPNAPRWPILFSILAVPVVILLVVALLQPVVHPSDPAPEVAAPTPVTTVAGDGIDRSLGRIAAENAKPGTKAWQVVQDPKTWDSVKGYASATSVDVGQSVTLFVTSTQTWHAEAYRMGYYQGNGGRLVWTSPDQPAAVQAPATTDPVTRMHEARWNPSLQVKTDATWPPGMYLFKLVNATGATFVPLVVRDDASRAAILVQSSVTTWQAYNDWGGATLYAGPRNDAKQRSTVVSFDRPYNQTGSGEFFGREFEFVYLVERLGLDVTYWTDIDLHERPQLLAQHKAFVSLGHDEYYSTAMRRGLEDARDKGVNLAFFGANAIFRKIRLEPSPLGPSRHEVNYREAKLDPLNGKDPSEVTVSWRDAPSNDPESSLVGSFYECNPVKADMVIAQADNWVFAGTGLKDGDKLPGVVGNEYDRVTPERPTPATIEVLAHSPVTCKGKKSFADASYYTAPSGAGVFDAGTFWWIPALSDDTCLDPALRSPRCQIQIIVANILQGFAAGPAGTAHPSVSNLDKLHIPRPKVDSLSLPGHGKTVPPPTTAPGTPSTAPDATDDSD